MIRQQLNDELKFKKLLRAINKKFYHQTISEEEFEAFIIKETGLPLQGFFNQYLRTTIIPVLEYKIDYANGRWNLHYRYQLVVDNFKMKIPLIVNGEKIFVEPTTEWQTLSGVRKGKEKLEVSVSKDYYLESKEQ